MNDIATPHDTFFCERRDQSRPPDIRQHVLSADAERLLDWSERILTAETLESVLH
jgi:hypothetical protein